MTDVEAKINEVVDKVDDTVDKVDDAVVAKELLTRRTMLL